MNKPKQFIKHLDIPVEKNVPNKHKKLKYTWLFFKFSIVFFIFSWAVFGIWSFISTHNFRTPVILQSPIVKKEIKIESPIATQSGIIKQVYAETLTPKQYVEKITIKQFGQSHIKSIHTLIENESSYNLYAINKSSGACGLFQFYPCSKLLSVCPDLDDLECVVSEGINYIKERYINPTGALAFWYQNGYY